MSTNNETGGKKNDDGKAPWHLAPWDAFLEIVWILAFGAKKYAERNWEEGIVFSRLYSALQRHLTAWWQDGEDNDPETGKSHLAHAGCCLVFMLAFVVRGRTDLDNRPHVLRLAREKQKYEADEKERAGFTPGYTEEDEKAARFAGYSSARDRAEILASARSVNS